MGVFHRPHESPTKPEAVVKVVRVAAGLRSDILSFVVILASALSGFGGLGVWAVGACAVALASLSYAEHYQLYRRGQKLGLTDALRSTVLRSFINALVASVGAYAGGVLLRLCFK